MKKLDELIKAVEICNDYDIECDGCPYIDIHGITGMRLKCVEKGLFPDALHYLKEYQMLQIAYLKAMADLEENPPLTWDELQQMEGKPVWVEDNIDEPEDTTKYWAIYRRIEKAQETEYALLSDFYYDKAQYGTTWQAYRKERK